MRSVPEGQFYNLKNPIHSGNQSLYKNHHDQTIHSIRETIPQLDSDTSSAHAIPHQIEQKKIIKMKGVLSMGFLDTETVYVAALKELNEKYREPLMFENRHENCLKDSEKILIFQHTNTLYMNAKRFCGNLRTLVDNYTAVFLKCCAFSRKHIFGSKR